jgi:peptidyl-tRNA hydrolase, PTH1 family
MKLVVGLGNPGRRYEGTRHNVGFRVVTEFARRHGPAPVRARFHGETTEVRLADDTVLLLTPTTYMNLSGTSVLEAQSFYKIELAQMLVVCDDMNLPLAKLRARTSGSAGGQKGLEDIIRRLGSQEVPRLRVGIGAAPEHWSWSDYVLSKFNETEIPLIDEAVLRAADAVETWVRSGIEQCMTRFN